MILARIFAVPALLAVLTAAGLISALLGDGVFDLASWICLAAPLGAAGWAILSACKQRGRRAS